jgi:hypothetical protein
MGRIPNSIADRFAAALDAEDYSAAHKLLAEGCVYHTRTAIIDGPDAIIDSYRINAESAKRRFDSVEYVSDVEVSSPLSAVISFTDRLRIGVESHEFHCRQEVRIGGDGLIDEIWHEELPEERQRLKDFEDRLTGRCVDPPAP